MALANCYSNLERDMHLIELTACFNGSCVDDVLLLACGGTLGFNAKFQSGFIYQYAFVMLLGLSALLTYLIVK